MNALTRTSFISIMLGGHQATILMLFLYLFSIFYLYFLIDYNESISSRSFKSNQTLKALPKSLYKEPLIVVSYEWPADPSWHSNWTEADKKSELYLSSCPHKCCFSVDRHLHEETADLMILNTFVIPQADMKSRRERIFEIQKKVGQIWAGVTTESAYYQQSAGRSLNDVYHWIFTYRKDADVFWPYLSFTNRTGPLHTTPQKRKSKKKLAAWLVSHCSTQSKREWLVQSLQHYIPVDIYGKCGKPGPEELDCRAYLAANYKFYLAFENSLCVDYVTEKLFAMLGQREGIVPVAYSWMNDTTIAPPHSYIDARDFKSIKALAEYLLHLDKNDDEYNRYLQWKNDYEIVFETVDTKLCKACQMLLKYKEQLAVGGERMKRQPSVLRRIRSLGNGENYTYFKVAGNLIKTNIICFNPFANKASRDWLLEGKDLMNLSQPFPQGIQ